MAIEVQSPSGVPSTQSWMWSIAALAAWTPAEEGAARLDDHGAALGNRRDEVIA